MGARPSSFKKGGGFLNNVDGVITGYEFTTEFPGGNKQKKGKNPDFTPLYMILSARVDGADEDVQTTLNAGNADNFEISDEGLTLVPVEEGFELSANSGVGKFITSLVEAGFPETNLPEDEINFEAIIGTRVRFVQETNVEATKKYGKRKSKDGKREYDRQDLKVSNVLALPSASKTNGKAATGTSPAKTTGKAGRAASGPDVSELTASTIMDILGETEDGSIAKSKLKFKIMQVFGAKHPNRDLRDDVLKMAFDDEFLAGLDGVIYNASDKTQTIRLA